MAVVLPSLFYEHDQVVEEQRSKPSRAEDVAKIERQLLEIYADPAVDEKPALLQQRGGAYYSEAAVHLIASLITDRGDVQVVNVRNDGTLPFLADEAVVEVPARVEQARSHPARPGTCRPALAGLIATSRRTRSWHSKQRSTAVGNACSRH